MKHFLPFRRGLARAGAFAVLSAFLLSHSAVWAAEGKPPKLYKKLTEEQAEEADQFALNNAIATVFHEAGHMLISEFSLPVLGKEEDAVDGLAVVLLLEAEDEDFNSAVEDFANVWFLTAGSADEDEELAFWDSHGLDEQRAYNTVCLMMGKDEKRFKDFADSLDFPEYRREQCPEEYQSLSVSWDRVLAPHEAGENDKTDFKITYEKTDDPQLAYFREMIKDAEILEMVAVTFSGSYKLKDGIKLTASECGEANAYWSPSDREMTLCYEDLLNSANLDAQWYIDNPDE
ncbi:DUF4344 domain-containing metallopeptidase [Rhizobium sp. S153]|uniref:DUF4344 domain-containing metallopeptidase n=1 Tax=Ciceribacter sichuanensis TaxID=2949647 RepID=A0ABT0V4L7_9HYPH|nr:DUF4344 domain-containing metallopeptidase [Ciceribacter sp. S153]MCM2400372.1 DUF4344 domain-containing metallopeptidase [Ciceribacter sp. S153]